MLAFERLDFVRDEIKALPGVGTKPRGFALKIVLPQSWPLWGFHWDGRMAMKARTILIACGSLFIISAQAAEPAGSKARVHGATPCCSVTAIDARTGMVSVRNAKTGKVTQYKAEPVGIKALKVGQKVDLAGGQLRTAAGAAIAGQVRP